MKAQELRIGNYFLYDNRVNEVLEITNAISGYRIVFKNEAKAKLVSYIHPIPLTEEWLRKLGFEFNGNTWQGDFDLGYSEWNFNDGVFVDYDDALIWGKESRINYVHELQNLIFTLTGEELTIK